MTEENKPTDPRDHLLDKEEWVRLSIHDVTEESKKRLYQTISLLGILATVFFAVIGWMGYGSIKDATGVAIEEILGSQETPTEFVRSIVSESVAIRTEGIKESITIETDSFFEEYGKEIKDEINRRVDHQIQEMNLRLDEAIKDSQ